MAEPGGTSKCVCWVQPASLTCRRRAPPPRPPPPAPAASCPCLRGGWVKRRRLLQVHHIQCLPSCKHAISRPHKSATPTCALRRLTGRARQQYALGQLAAQPRELVGVLQVLHNLLPQQREPGGKKSWSLSWSSSTTNRTTNHQKCATSAAKPARPPACPPAARRSPHCSPSHP